MMGKRLESCPIFEGKAYRGESGYAHEPGQTAADVMRYEQEELGNDYGIAAEMYAELENYPATDLVWVTKQKGIAARYGSPEEVPIPEGSRIIATDDEGGYLVLKTAINPEARAMAGGVEIVQRQYSTPAGAVVEFGIREGDKVFLSRGTATAPSAVSDMVKGWQPVPEETLANYKSWLGKSGKWGGRAAEIDYLQKNAKRVIQQGHATLARLKEWERQGREIEKNLASASRRGYGLKVEDLTVGDEIEWAGDGSHYIVTEFDETGHVYARPVEKPGQAGGSINLAEYKLVKGEARAMGKQRYSVPNMMYLVGIWRANSYQEIARPTLEEAQEIADDWGRDPKVERITIYDTSGKSIYDSFKRKRVWSRPALSGEHHSWNTARAIAAAGAGVVAGLVRSPAVPIVGLAGGLLAQAGEDGSSGLRKAQYITAGVVDGSAALFAKGLFG